MTNSRLLSGLFAAKATFHLCTALFLGDLYHSSVARQPPQFINVSDAHLHYLSMQMCIIAFFAPSIFYGIILQPPFFGPYLGSGVNPGTGMFIACIYAR